jgi:hypothetical protein
MKRPSTNALAATLTAVAIAAGMMVTSLGHAASPLPVQAPELPPVEKVLERCVLAVGGRNVVDRIETLYIKTTFSMQTEMEYEQWWSRDGGRRVRTVLPGAGEVIMGTDGEVAWMKSPMGYMLATPDQADQMRTQAGMFMFMLDPRSFAKDDIGAMAIVDEVEFGGTLCYKLHYLTKDDREGFAFFAKEGGLPIGFVQHGPEGTDRVDTMLLKNWKEVKGVHFFHTIEMQQVTKQSVSPMRTERDAEEDTVIKGHIWVKELTVNEVDKKLFELPPTIVELVNEQKAVADGTAEEVKLEDLSPEMQKNATNMIAGMKMLNATQREQAIQQFQAAVSSPQMPEENKKMMLYVLQELRKG